MTEMGRWPSSSLLGSISELSRDRLMQAGTTREYPTGHRLIIQGDHDTFVIVLLDGVVKATIVSSAGKEALLAVRVAGDLIGEFAAIDGQPRSSTVTACGPVTGLTIRQPEFLALMARDRAIAEAVDRSMVAKMRAGNERRVEFSAFDAFTRFARVIRELVVTYGEHIGNRVTLSWPVTQSELASLASVAEPTAQKSLRRLRDAGVITTHYRSLIVEDFHELNRIAGA